MTFAISTVNGLPRSIERAIAIIATFTSSDNFTVISCQNKIILAELLRCADARDITQPIIVRKALLATRIGVSESTLYRGLAELERAGWFKRSEQYKSRKHGFSVGELVLTLEAQALLFPSLSTREVASQKAVTEPSACLSSKTDALKKSFESKDSQSLQRQQRPAGFIESKLPEDCRPLLAYLKPFAIFKLMGLATQVNKKLGDVVAYATTSLKRVRNVYAYLVELINRDIDYAYLKHQQTIEKAQKLKQEMIAKAEKEWIAKHQKSRLVDPTTGTVYEAEKGTNFFLSYQPSQEGRVSRGAIPAVMLAKYVSSGKLALVPLDDNKLIQIAAPIALRTKTIAPTSLKDLANSLKRGRSLGPVVSLTA